MRAVCLINISHFSLSNKLHPKGGPQPAEPAVWVGRCTGPTPCPLNSGGLCPGGGVVGGASALLTWPSADHAEGEVLGPPSAETINKKNEIEDLGSGGWGQQEGTLRQGK